jgi:hypothetical protein
METNRSKSAVGKFPLRLMPSIRKRAEEFSRKEGVSLNQFINIAVAERLVHLQHDAWLAARPKPTPVRISRALAALDRRIEPPPDAGDELPEGYVSIRETPGYPRTVSRRKKRS